MALERLAATSRPSLSLGEPGVCREVALLSWRRTGAAWGEGRGEELTLGTGELRGASLPFPCSALSAPLHVAHLLFPLLRGACSDQPSLQAL